MDLLTADFTFVNERLAKFYGLPGVYGSDFRRVPLADAHRRGLLGQAQHPDGDVLLRSHLAGRPRQVDSRERARHPAAAAAAQRAGAARRTAPGPAALDARAHERRIAPIRCAPPAIRAWIRWGSRSKTSTRSAAGATAPRADRAIDASGAMPDGTKFDGAARAAGAAGEEPRAVRDGRHREAADLRAGPRRRVLRCARRFAASCAARRRGDISVADLIVGLVNSTPFQMRQ